MTRQMMTNPNKVGVVFGALSGGFHLCWSLLVLLGWAQPIIDFIFWAHMIRPVYAIQPFNAAAAVTLIILTSAIGYLFGIVAAIVWNKLHRSG
jgi:hypothetical protein